LAQAPLIQKPPSGSVPARSRSPTMPRAAVAVALAAPLGLALLGFFTLPTASGPAETLQAHGRLLLHLLGVAPKLRHTDYGRRQPAAPRQANGSIPEIQGFVEPEEFKAKYMWKEPVVFRGGATAEFGFDLACLVNAEKSVEKAFADQLSGKKIRIFKDQYDDSSAELMTMDQYGLLVEQARVNASKPAPYARAFPQNSMHDCRPVPTEKMNEYHSWFGSMAQTYMPEPDFSVLFTSYTEGTNTKMHIDIGNSFVTQVAGRKKWLFVDPEYTTNMQVYGDRLNLVFIAGFDVFREPVPPEVHLKEVIAYPGDIIYFPTMTFHAVYNLDPVTISVDNTAPDLPGAVRRHWLLTAATVLNPWIIIKGISIFVNTGSFSGTDLYFDGYVSKGEGEL